MSMLNNIFKKLDRQKYPFIDGLYYLLPQTTDLLGSAVPMSVYTGGIDTIAPFVQGTLFMVAMLVLATWRFERRDF